MHLKEHFNAAKASSERQIREDVVQHMVPPQVIELLRQLTLEVCELKDKVRQLTGGA